MGRIYVKSSLAFTRHTHKKVLSQACEELKTSPQPALKCPRQLSSPLCNPLIIPSVPHPP